MDSNSTTSSLMKPLCSLVSFVTNGPDSLLAPISELSWAEARVFGDVLSSSEEIESLYLNNKLPLDMMAALSETLSRCRIRRLIVNFEGTMENSASTEIIKIAAAAMGPMLEHVRLLEMWSFSEPYPEDLFNGIAKCTSLSELEIQYYSGDMYCIEDEIVDENSPYRPDPLLDPQRISIIGMLVKLVDRLPMLRRFKICGLYMNADCSAMLGKALWRVQALEVSRYAQGVEAMFRAMGGDASITELRIGVSDETAKIVSKYIRGASITELDMSGSQITTVGAKDLANMLAKAAKIQVLRMGGNSRLNSDGSAVILSALAWAGLSPMEVLDLNDCNIGDEGAKEVGELIARRGCRNVYLSSNSIQGAGIGAIADGVERSRMRYGMAVLDLRQNPAGNEGAAQIADKIIRPNRVVEVLRMTRTSITDEGAMLIVSALKERKDGMLRTLTVSRMGCTKGVLRALNDEQDRERKVAPDHHEVLRLFNSAEPDLL